MKRSELIFSALLLPVDFCMLILAGLAAYLLRISPWVSQWRPVLFNLSLPFPRYLGIVFVVSLFGLAVFALSGLYKMRASRKLFQEFSQIVIATSAGIMAIIVFIFLKGEWFDSRFIILAAWLFAIIFVSISRFFMKKLQRYLVGKYNVGVHNILVVGGDRMSENIIKEINRQPDLGYRIVKHFPVMDIERIKLAAGNPGIDEVILASPQYSRDEVLDLLNFCEEQRIGFKFVPNLFQTLTTNIEIDTFGGVPLIEIKRTPLDGWGKIAKRTMDILGAIFGLPLLSPFFLIIALMIKLDSEGPVFAKLKRVSQGREFYLYKFRSMIKDAHRMKAKFLEYNERRDGPLFKMRDDPRITRVGRVLRKYRIDEFPQLINVLRGEMSLVGPRPHEPDEVEKYQRHHKKVLLLKPGITGFAQISGSSDLLFEQEVKLDTFYIENWSLKKDIHILIKTFLVLFTDRSAC